MFSMLTGAEKHARRLRVWRLLSGWSLGECGRGEIDHAERRLGVTQCSDDIDAATAFYCKQLDFIVGYYERSSGFDSFDAFYSLSRE